MVWHHWRREDISCEVSLFVSVWLSQRLPSWSYNLTHCEQIKTTFVAEHLFLSIKDASCCLPQTTKKKPPLFNSQISFGFIFPPQFDLQVILVIIWKLDLLSFRFISQTPLNITVISDELKMNYNMNDTIAFIGNLASSICWTTLNKIKSTPMVRHFSITGTKLPFQKAVRAEWSSFLSSAASSLLARSVLLGSSGLTPDRQSSSLVPSHNWSQT